jgi:hypothetical protein
MFNANFSTIPTIRTSDRLICVWVPTGDPRMPLTCVWIQDAPSREDLIVDGVVDDPDPEHYFFPMHWLDPSTHRPASQH